MVYPRIPNLTDELKKQKMDDIFREFYRLETILNNNEWFAQNYIVIRLVTIIEQFFREVITIQLQKKKMKSKKEITLRTDDLGDVGSISPERVIAASYSCQSSESMKGLLKEASLKNIFSAVQNQHKISLDGFKSLFFARHNIVHTVTLSTFAPSAHHQMIEDLMKLILYTIYNSDDYFYFFKGNAFFQLTNFQTTLKYFNKINAVKFNSTDLYYNKGLALGMLNEYSEAIQCFDDVIKLDPSNARAYLAKSATLSQMDRHKEALRWADEAIKLDPEIAVAHSIKASSLAYLGKHEQALQCLDEAIKRDPEIAEAYDLKGLLLKQLGKNKEAKQCFEKAARLRSSSVSGEDNLLT